jgi:hypothetical protein
MNKTLQDLVNTAPGSFFSGSFQANVSECKSINTKTGKTFFKATLTEGGVEASAMSFTRDLSPLQGKLVKFGGMGIKRGDDFGGKAQVSLGDKSIISPVGESVPPASIIGVGTVSPAIQGRIEGVTVGMAVNKAVEIAIANGTVNEACIYYQASMLIRLAQKLQAGNLAPESSNEPSEEEPY